MKTRSLKQEIWIMSETTGLSISERYGILWIILPRVISASNTLSVSEEIFSTLDKTDGDVAIDLSETDYLYSTGINLMIKIKKRLSRDKRSVSLVNLSSAIHGELESVHLDKVFPVYTTETEMEISKDLIWERKLMEDSGKFIFIPKHEGDLLVLSFSGNMDSLNDLSSFQDYSPDISQKGVVIDMENLEVMDRFGVQVFFEKMNLLAEVGDRIAVFGTNPTISGLISIFSDEEDNARIKVFDTKSEAVDYVSSQD